MEEEKAFLKEAKQAFNRGQTQELIIKDNHFASSIRRKVSEFIKTIQRNSVQSQPPMSVSRTSSKQNSALNNQAIIQLDPSGESSRKTLTPLGSSNKKRVQNQINLKIANVLMVFANHRLNSRQQFPLMRGVANMYMVLYNVGKTHPTIDGAIFYFQQCLKKHPFCVEAVYDLVLLLRNNSRVEQSTMLINSHLNGDLRNHHLIHSLLITSPGHSLQQKLSLLHRKSLNLLIYYRVAVLLKQVGVKHGLSKRRRQLNNEQYKRNNQSTENNYCNKPKWVMMCERVIKILKENKLTVRDRRLLIQAQIQTAQFYELTNQGIHKALEIYLQIDDDSECLLNKISQLRVRVKDIPVCVVESNKNRGRTAPHGLTRKQPQLGRVFSKQFLLRRELNNKKLQFLLNKQKQLALHERGIMGSAMSACKTYGRPFAFRINGGVSMRKMKKLINKSNGSMECTVGESNIQQVDVPVRYNMTQTVGSNTKNNHKNKFRFTQQTSTGFLCSSVELAKFEAQFQVRRKELQMKLSNGNVEQILQSLFGADFKLPQQKIGKDLNNIQNTPYNREQTQTTTKERFKASSDLSSTLAELMCSNEEYYKSQSGHQSSVENTFLTKIQKAMELPNEEGLTELLQLYKEYKKPVQKQQLLLRVGRVYEKMNQFIKAEKAFSKCAKMQSAEGFLQLGTLQMRQGRIRSGVQNVEKANCLNRMNLAIQNKLVYGYSLREQTMDKALMLAHTILKKHPQSITTLLITADVLQKQNKVKEAIEVIQAVDNHKQHHLIKHYLGVLYLQNGELQCAFDCFKEALKLNPCHCPSLIQIGSILSEGTPEQAVFILNKVLELESDNVLALSRLGKIYEDVLHDCENAMKLYRKAFQIQKDPQLLVKVGDCLCKQEHLQQALSTYQQASKLRECHLTHSKMAQIHQKNGELPQAIYKLQLAMKLLPKDEFQYRVDYLKRISNLSLSCAQFQGAIQSIQQLLQFQENTELYRKLGEAYLGKRNYDWALQNFQKAYNLRQQQDQDIKQIQKVQSERKMTQRQLTIKQLHVKQGVSSSQVCSQSIPSEDIQLLLSMAMCFDCKEEYLASRQLYQKILSADADHPRATQNLANVYLLLGECSLAFQLFQKQISANPDDFQTRLNLSDLYATLGDWSKVEHHLNKCYQSEPNHLPLLQKLLRLYNEKRDTKMAAKFEKKVAMMQARALRKKQNTPVQ